MSEDIACVLDSISDGVILVDKEFKVEYANPVFRNYFNHDDLVGGSMFALMTFKTARLHQNLSDCHTTCMGDSMDKRSLPIVHGCGKTTHEICSLRKKKDGWAFIVNFSAVPSHRLERRDYTNKMQDDLSEITLSTFHEKMEH